jgi:two-component system, chemotaxis family, CheB/CheR fusion protein
VGIGAAAGDLEAIEVFFKAMPMDTDMAFVVVQQRADWRDVFKGGA